MSRNVASADDRDTHIRRFKRSQSRSVRSRFRSHATGSRLSGGYRARLPTLLVDDPQLLSDDRRLKIFQELGSSALVLRRCDGDDLLVRKHANGVLDALLRFYAKKTVLFDFTDGVGSTDKAGGVGASLCALRSGGSSTSGHCGWCRSLMPTDVWATGDSCTALAVRGGVASSIVTSVPRLPRMKQL